jgi:hypothetical protein
VRQHHVDSRTRVSSRSMQHTHTAPHRTLSCLHAERVNVTACQCLSHHSHALSLQHRALKDWKPMHEAFAVCADAHCGCVAMAARTMSLFCNGHNDMHAVRCGHHATVCYVGGCMTGCDSKLALRGLEAHPCSICCMHGRTLWLRGHACRYNTLLQHSVVLLMWACGDVTRNLHCDAL